MYISYLKTYLTYNISYLKLIIIPKIIKTYEY